MPARSANLGPGFDSFGVALHRHDTITARGWTPTGWSWGSPAWAPTTCRGPRTTWSLRAAVAGFAALGEPVPGLDLKCANHIPHGGGQGSSAAAMVAGMLLARG